MLTPAKGCFLQSVESFFTRSILGTPPPPDCMSTWYHDGGRVQIQRFPTDQATTTHQFRRGTKSYFECTSSSGEWSVPKDADQYGAKNLNMSGRKSGKTDLNIEDWESGSTSLNLEVITIHPMMQTCHNNIIVLL
jgi:hypothetical protein